MASCLDQCWPSDYSAVALDTTSIMNGASVTHAVTNSHVDEADDSSIEPPTNFCLRQLPITPVIGNAFDMILVQSTKQGLMSSSHQTVSCSDALFSFGTSYPLPSPGSDPPPYRVVLKLDDPNGDTVQFPVLNRKIQYPKNPADAFVMREREHVRERQNGKVSHPGHDVEALKLLTSCLQSGKNPAQILLLNRDNDAVLGIAELDVFFWNDRHRVVVMDVDGTITKSNVRGVLDTVVIESYRYCHEGVCRFLSSIRDVDKDVQLFYLTSRPISFANKTRKFLSSLRQSPESYQLPPGPLVGYIGSLHEVLFMELVTKKVHEHKINALQTQVLQPFSDVGASDVLRAGFGNSLTDMEAYHMSGISLDSIYMIDKQSNIYSLDQGCDNYKNAREYAVGFVKKTDQLPTIQAQQCRQDYMRARGTLFEGYHDSRLLQHLKAGLKKVPVI